MTTNHVSPKLPPSGASPRDVATKHNAVCNGRSDAFATITLTASTVRTVVTESTDPAIAEFGEDSVPCFCPLTATAATAFGSGSFWVSARGNGRLTIEHPSTADANKTYAMSWQG